MGLREYRNKRHFAKTPEPKGEKAKRARHQRFVIQKHAARRLHYDFRLEIDGVLKSWAVPKGPCLDPAEKRLAAHVEDHPLEYRDFEGIIPHGEYGGGTVLVWDQGTWDADHDLAAAYNAGRMKFRLNGKKLHGGWNLVRMQAKKTGADDWLLIKEDDEAARPRSDYDVTTAEQRSIKTGRTLEEIAAQADRVWHSSRSNGKASEQTITRTRTPRRKPIALSLRAMSRAKRAPLSERVELQLATLKSHPPEGPQWIHEIKFDGYRMLCRIDRGKATLITRKRLDWTHRFADLAAQLSLLPVKNAWLDGEIVALRPTGISDFGELQRSFTEGTTSKLTYSAFDLLYVNGYDLRLCALLERKRLLSKVLSRPPHGVQYVDHIAGNGKEFFEQCCQMGLEGAICKRGDRPHLPGRTDDWIKVKCKKEERFVVGGYIDPHSRRAGFGGLLLGTYGRDRMFNFEGRTGTGFSAKEEADLLKKLEGLSRKTSPFVTPPPREGRRRMHWVQPKLVARVQFTERTDDGLLRHAAFQGLDNETDPSSIVRDPVIDASKEKPLLRSTRSTMAESRRKRPRSVMTEDKLAQLKGVELTHPQKVMYPLKGITKFDLVEYYIAVSDWMLPQIVHRPLSMVRCPDGAGGQSFYQKHPSAGTPDVLTRIPISEDHKREDYLMVENLAGLVSLVQMGILEIHPWGSRGDLLERPDRMFFDLDPDEAVPWVRTVAAALELRDRLESLGLVSFVKTTGGKGLHIVVPLERRSTWEDVKGFSHALTNRMVEDAPRDFVGTMSKAARKGKIIIDYLRNARGATAIAPYSTRKRDEATVSMPLEWGEVSERIRPDHFDVRNAVDRIKTLRTDPWADMNAVKQGMTAAARRKVGIG